MPQYPTPPEMVIDSRKTYTATIETTAGTMTAELFAAEVPHTVNNFVFLARDGFYAELYNSQFESAEANGVLAAG